ncbi:MAG: 2-hydroxyacid dehydrogenase, partial [Brevundimonas sp.]
MTQPHTEILLLASLPGLEETPPQIAFHPLFDEPDAVAFLKANGRRFRGIAASGRSLVDQALLAHLPSLEIIASFGVGYDRVDLDAVRSRGIVVTNTPDILTEEVADLALGLVIATTRRMPQAERYLRAGAWTSAPFPLSPSLRGRTAGIFGLGRIGKAIASRLEACGVTVAYHGRSRQHDVAYAYYDSLEEMARAVDIIILAAPGGPETLHAIDRTMLQALGPQGILINIARGSLVDEDALCEALEDGTILAAGLDVF